MTQITSVACVLEAVRSLADMLGGKLYFRGHADETYALIPSVARTHTVLTEARTLTTTASEEANLLHCFRRYTYEHRQRVLTLWEALFLARHHGLPTRLLDWTTNPLVALFFACAARSTDSASEGGAIWSFVKRRPWSEDVDVFDPSLEDPFAVPGIRVLFPFNPTPRITAQSGVFTLQDDPSFDLRRLQTEHRPDCDIEELRALKIPEDAKLPLLRELHRVGIHDRSLFPDLEGVAKSIIARTVLFPW